MTLARQNDYFRLGLQRGASPFPGSVVVTAGVHARGRDFQTDAFLAVAADTSFTEDNDPWGTHDFGTVTVRGEKLYWKIDYYEERPYSGLGNLTPSAFAAQLKPARKVA